MFTIEMLPADYGESLLIQYGKVRDRHRILIDAGTKKAYKDVKRRIEALPAKERRFELLVVTHVDFDHIGGILPLLKDAESLGVTFGEIWFNGYAHLAGDSVGTVDILGPKHGEALTKLIDAGGAARWNRSVKGAPIEAPDTGKLPVLTLPGGMALTVLAPSRGRLEKFIPKWEEECEAAGLVPGTRGKEPDEDFEDVLGDDVELLAASRFKEDAAEANGTSIVFIAEYGGSKALLTGDALPSDILNALARVPRIGKTPYQFDAVKLSHHGSKGNTSPALFAALRSNTWLVSTNGAKFGHPSPETIARLITSEQPKPTLHFNYRTEFNKQWADATLQKRYGYRAAYGPKAGGLLVKL